jgi:hypothetical protein
MLDRFKPALLDKLAAILPPSHGMTKVTSGRAAAKSIVKLMDDVATLIPPLDLCEAFQELGARPTVPTLTALWTRFGDDTARALALGIRCLAMIWDSAWQQGAGHAIPAAKLAEIDHKKLRTRYNDRTFVPSLTLDDIGAAL